MLLGLINIGSTTAFNAILSLAVVGLQTSYLMPIGLVLWRRFYSPQDLVWGPWRLGRAGVYVNVVAFAYLTFTCVMLLFPSYQPVTAENMNYAVVVFMGMLLFGGAYWIFFARHTYMGPLVEMEEVEATMSVSVSNLKSGVGVPSSVKS